MPAYSFQERFVPFIEEGSKNHTVRAERAGRSRHAVPGDTLYLYTGMRTRECRKIGEATCENTEAILIDLEGIELDGDDYVFRLSPADCDAFAWADGFRPAGSTSDEPAGAWQLMLRWFQQTHELPFHGVVIYWKDFAPAKK